MELGQLSPQQRDQLRAMVRGGYDINPGQMLGQGLEALDIALEAPAIRMQRGLQRGAAHLPGWAGGPTKDAAGYLTRFAGSKPAQIALKAGTGLGAVGGALGAVDVVAGNDSLANKTMDATAMGIGGFLGAAGGPVGIAAGAGLGKAASDSLQWLFGDKKTAEQRQMEQPAWVTGSSGEIK